MHHYLFILPFNNRQSSYTSYSFHFISLHSSITLHYHLTSSHSSLYPFLFILYSILSFYLIHTILSVLNTLVSIHLLSTLSSFHSYTIQYTLQHTLHPIHHHSKHTLTIHLLHSSTIHIQFILYSILLTTVSTPLHSIHQILSSPTLIHITHTLYHCILTSLFHSSIYLLSFHIIHSLRPISIPFIHTLLFTHLYSSFLLSLSNNLNTPYHYHHSCHFTHSHTHHHSHNTHSLTHCHIIHITFSFILTTSPFTQTHTITLYHTQHTLI